MQTLKLLIYTALACFLWYAVAYGEPIVVPPILPNIVMTPGDTMPGVTREKICLSGYTGSVRNVSQKNKNSVFSMYFLDPTKDKFEVDHLVSLELGGSNSIQNLWPQSYTTQPLNAYRKDRLENKLHALVCSGHLDLATAQKAIATDWIAAYKKYVGN